MKFITLLLISGMAFSASWTTKVSERGKPRFGPSSAKQSAINSVSRYVGTYTNYCSSYGGVTSASYEINDCWLSGVEDFQCSAAANISCDLGDVEVVENEKLEGLYLGMGDGAFMQINADRTFTGNFVVPSYNGKIITKITKLNRVDETTYRADASFSALSGQCSGAAAIQVKKLTDGTILLQITSQKSVSSIIFGYCKWNGTVSSYFELSPVKLVKDQE